MKRFLFLALLSSPAYADSLTPPAENIPSFSNLINHCHAQIVFDSKGKTRFELTDIFLKALSYKSVDLLEFQAGLSVNPADHSTVYIDPVVSAFFRIDPYLRDVFSIPDYPIIRSLELGPVYGYDLRFHNGYLGLQFNFVFGIS